MPQQLCIANNNSQFALTGDNTTKTGLADEVSLETNSVLADSGQLVLSHNSVDNNTPFFSNLRNSLSYGRKGKRHSLCKDNDKVNEAKTKKGKLNKKDKKSKVKKNMTVVASDHCDGEEVTEDGIPGAADGVTSPPLQEEDALQSEEASGEHDCEDKEEEVEGNYMQGLQPVPFSSAISKSKT